MQVSIEGDAAEIVDRLVKTGRFDSPRAVIEHALGLSAAENVKLQALRAMVAASLADEEEGTEADLDAELAETMAQLEREGY